MTEIGMVCRSPSTQLSEWKGLDKQKAIASTKKKTHFAYLFVFKIA